MRRHPGRSGGGGGNAEKRAPDRLPQVGFADSQSSDHDRPKPEIAETSPRKQAAADAVRVRFKPDAKSPRRFAVSQTKPPPLFWGAAAVSSPVGGKQCYEYGPAPLNNERRQVRLGWTDRPEILPGAKLLRSVPWGNP
jgi:hypothetical protein